MKKLQLFEVARLLTEIREIRSKVPRASPLALIQLALREYDKQYFEEVYYARAARWTLDIDVILNIVIEPEYQEDVRNALKLPEPV